MKFKRIIAYIIDFFIITLIASIIFTLPCFQKNNTTYEENVENYIKAIQNTEITEEELIDTEYNLYKSSSSLLIIRVIVIILYLGVLGYLKNGQTLGKKICKIQIVPNKGKNLKPGLFMLREMIVGNVFLELISLIGLICCSKNTWQIIATITSDINLMINLILLLSMIFDNNERALHDKIFGTKIIKKEKNMI